MTEIALAFSSLSITWITGAALYILLFGRTTLYSRGYVACLAFGLGLGLLAQIHLIWSLLHLPGTERYWIDIGVLLLSLAVLKRKWPTSNSQLTPVSTQENSVWGKVVITYSLVLALTGGFILWQSISLLPYGAGDAVTNWYPKARYLFFSQSDEWQHQFSPLLPNWMHADYPLMLPLSLARGWSVIGHTSIFYSQLLHFTIAMTAFGLVFFFLSARISSMAGAIALSLLFTMPQIYWLISVQYADALMCWYVTAIVSQLAGLSDRRPSNRRLVMLVALTAAFSVFAKNEGWILVIGVLILFTARAALARRNVADLMPLTIVMIVGIALPLLYKQAYAPANDIVGAACIADILEFVNPERLMALYHKSIAVVGSGPYWGWTPSVVGIVLLLAILRASLRRSAPPWEASTYMVLISFGYLGALVLIPLEYKYEWFLHFSLDRLLFQLWPSAILSAFILFSCQKRSHCKVAA